MKIALAHDYLTQLGGAEKVLQNLCQLYPGSPVFVLVQNRGKTGHVFPPSGIKTSWLQHFPRSVKNYEWYLTLMPRATESHKLSGYDIVISSASSIAKGIKLPSESLHICYCHTPTRYLWHDRDHYVEELKYNKLIKKIIPIFLDRLKNWDLLAAGRVDHFIANSAVVKDRIKAYYNRDSHIIYPPVETDKFYLSDNIDNYYLIGGRLVVYKRYDLAIKAFNKLGIKLKIFGNGPDYKRLKKMARRNIEFIGAVDDKHKAELYSRAIAFINPQVEDFGITAVESMASGRPVIAYASGGALETVVPDLSGEFFPEQKWESLANQIIHFKPEKYRSGHIKDYAEKFSTKRFREELEHHVKSLVKNYEIDKVFSIK